jgi:triphosphoribosyl-dephospho-CoA synthetase
VLPGAHLRAKLDIGGVRREAESGLRAVFEDALPAFRHALEATGRTSASFLAMARLMQTIEDTTAIRRAGMAGLARVRRDGAELERRLRGGEDPGPLLLRWNEEYRSMNLTMGGVADCLALTLAIDSIVPHW